MAIDYSKIKKIELKSKILSESINHGLYSSAFKGTGLDYSQSREYIEGDDIRHIDSLVSARLGSLFIKQFDEERQINVILMVDVSSSMFSGAYGKSKYETMLALVAIIAYSAYYNNDNIGLLLFDNEVKKYLPPEKNPNTIANIINIIINSPFRDITTNLAKPLEYIAKVQNQSAVLFIISDFLAENFETELKIVQKKFDTILIHLVDDFSSIDNENGFVNLTDIETNKQQTIELNDFRKNVQTIPNGLKRIAPPSIQSSRNYIRLKAGDNTYSKFLNFMQIRAR